MEQINPHNLEAEEQILGAILVENKLIRKISVSVEDFYSTKNRELYSAMLALNIDGIPIELVSLKEKGFNPVDVSRYANNIISLSNIDYHCEIIKDCGLKRKLKRLCLEIISNIDEPIENLTAMMRTGLSGIAKIRGGEIITTADIAKELEAFIDRRRKNRSQLSGITSGFPKLDQLTDGFQGGDQIVLAARPGHGKSALAMTFAQNAEVPVGVISIEMGSHQIGIRSLASLSGVELWKLRKGILSDMDYANVITALGRLAELPIYFSFSSKNVTEIERNITQMVESYGCRMIVIDYLQLTKGTQGKKREQEVAEVSRTLKLLAQGFNLPIISLSQLNREVEKRENKQPILSDLRESGAIEQDADVIIFLHAKDAGKDGVVKVIIAKGRNIGLGEVYLYFKGDIMDFKETTRDEFNAT